ncbi:DNA methyltransferase [Nitrobacter sp. TKz-YC01]|uniref:DNA methyltransferase n=1 Tax=Nitrobacter sp. TKz-YC01 TaxID=3398703 RepID=UPI003A1009DD
MHPTVKPLALVADAILDCSKRGGIVLDVFAGSGTTLIASEKTGRRGYGIEIDPHYVDVIIRRFQQVYGITAIHADLKTEFEKIRFDRARPRGKQNDKKSEDNQENAKKIRRSKARP